jgi:hypothetical protein
MGRDNPVERLKALLRDEVERFCLRREPSWEAVSDILKTIRDNRWRAVLFGGTLRSLLISQFLHQREGRPRDVDIVIQGAPLEILRELFEKLIARETRFGGLQLRKQEWLFDVWPLERTWAIVEDDKVGPPSFSYLPSTTFLNVEAVAVDVWPTPGQVREIYSGDDQFFHAILNRVVEVNRIANPFPELCVVRALVMVSDLGCRIGPRLAQYIAHHGPNNASADLERIQEKHYGRVRIPGATLEDWIRTIRQSLDAGPIPELSFSTKEPQLGLQPQSMTVN